MHGKLEILLFSFHRTSIDSSLVLTSEEKWCKTAMLMAASNTPERYGSRMQSLANTSACRIQEVQSPEWYQSANMRNENTCTSGRPSTSAKIPKKYRVGLLCDTGPQGRKASVLTESRYIFQDGSTILARHPYLMGQYTVVCCYVTEYSIMLSITLGRRSLQTWRRFTLASLPSRYPPATSHPRYLPALP